MSRQPTRRANIRRTVQAHRRGRPQDAPNTAPRWARWCAGMARAAKAGKKIAADLNRRKQPDRATYGRAFRIAAPGRTPNPKLPARQARFKRQPGPRTDLGTLRGAR